jgi:hypothetical protein
VNSLTGPTPHGKHIAYLDFIREADLMGQLPDDVVRYVAARSHHVGLDRLACVCPDELAVALMEVAP